ncbi:MAG: hypothetical protein GWO26_31455 [Phycisphaerae bacterium]|nr:hypothetical protein [Phycisphaerae bacterium]
MFAPILLTTFLLLLGIAGCRSLPSATSDLDGDEDVDLSDLTELGSNWQTGI